VPANVDPFSVPVNAPFISTMPVGRSIITGPLTAAPFCDSSHVMRTELLCTAAEALHVPETLAAVTGCGVVVVVGVVVVDGDVIVVLLSVHAAQQVSKPSTSEGIHNWRIWLTLPDVCLL